MADIVNTYIESQTNNFFFYRSNRNTYRVRQIPFFQDNSLKKRLNIFSNLFFYLKLQSFRLIIANNFIQMVASAGHAVAYMIAAFFQHIIECVVSQILSFKESIVCQLKKKIRSTQLTLTATSCLFQKKKAQLWLWTKIRTKQ